MPKIRKLIQRMTSPHLLSLEKSNKCLVQKAIRRNPEIPVKMANFELWQS
jgi:hypothetical protein